jgi:hypothetical protein
MLEVAMFSIHRFVPVLVALYALTACATAPSRFTRHIDTTQRVAPPVDAYVTGSRIPVPADESAGAPASNSAQQVVTQQEITLTGQSNLGAALRQLVPTLY